MREVDLLIEAIEILTQQIIDRLQGEDFEGLDALVAQRLELLTQLVALGHENKKAQAFLNTFQEKDEEFIQALSERCRQIKQVIANIDNIGQYVVNQ